MKLLSVVILGSLAAANGSAAGPSDFKAFMKAMVPKIQKAFATKDVAFFDSIAAPDFVDKSLGQTLGRRQAMKEMKAEMGSVKSMKLDMKLVSAEASGGIGRAVTAGNATFTTKPGKGGKSHVMSMRFIERQTWVRSGSTWKLKVLDETMSDGKMDGKPMRQGGAGH